MSTPGTVNDIRATPTQPVTWVWGGKTFTARRKPWNWGHEQRALEAFWSAAPVNLPALVDYVFDYMVEESSVPLGAPDRMAYDPEFVWEAARALGALEAAHRLGIAQVMGGDRKNGDPRSSSSGDSSSSGSGASGT